MTSDPLTAQTAGELMAWYADMGITEALDDVAHDRFAASASEVQQPQPVEERQPPPPVRRELPQRAAPSPVPASRAPDNAAAIAPDAAALEARNLARKAASLEELQGLMASFEGCALKATASSLCFADGNPKARLMLVGEAPGAEEDRSGLPFVGRSGQLLDAMLAAIGLKRETDVYIANVVPWRPPGNRTPTPQEVAICLPFIQRQIELVNPDIMVCIGAPSAQALLGIRSITASRGKWMDYDTGARKIRAIAMLHPAYLLRQPLQKRQAWRDFRALKAAMASLPPTVSA